MSTYVVERPECRFRTYAFDRHVFPRLLIDGYRYAILNGVPPDARLIGASWDELRGQFLVTLQHDSWDPVEEGQTAVLHHVAVHVEPPVPWSQYPLRGIRLSDLDDGSTA